MTTIEEIYDDYVDVDQIRSPSFCGDLIRVIYEQDKRIKELSKKISDYEQEIFQLESKTQSHKIELLSIVEKLMRLSVMEMDQQ